MMPGIKRARDGVEKKESEISASPFMPMFETFRSELDEHHDRKERIIKASRDITAASKKMIFALQRVRTLRSDIPPKIAQENRERAAAMLNQFTAISADLKGINAWRYQRQISGGIQEYMEAITFDHYLRHQTLMTIEEASATLPDIIELTGDDYVLGIFDLVGELMRFAITTMATTGALAGSSKTRESREGAIDRDILMDMRELRMSFEELDTTSCGGTSLAKDVEKKMEVMKTCVEKVETAVYGMIIRGQERPKGWVPDLSGDRAPVESY
ncbi:Translin [Bisporella sp. PMI_857]|nr:Translin [Bisporella sp. PMI_857]